MESYEYYHLLVCIININKMGWFFFFWLGMHAVFINNQRRIADIRNLRNL